GRVVRAGAPGADRRRHLVVPAPPASGLRRGVGARGPGREWLRNGYGGRGSIPLRAREGVTTGGMTRAPQRLRSPESLPALPRLTSLVKSAVRTVGQTARSVRDPGYGTKAPCQGDLLPSRYS